MRKSLITAVLMTVATTFLLGIVYPLAITGISQLLFRDEANGQLIYKDGKLIGSRIIGQPFTGPGYFHSRPSDAGKGYDATNSGGSNFGPTNQKLVARVESDVARVYSENSADPIPVDLVTTSASGLDPDITPAAAYFQVRRIARERRLDVNVVSELVRKHTVARDLEFLGEPRVNVLGLNLALDELVRH